LINFLIFEIICNICNSQDPQPAIGGVLPHRRARDCRETGANDGNNPVIVISRMGKASAICAVAALLRASRLLTSCHRELSATVENSPGLSARSADHLWPEPATSLRPDQA